MSRDLVLAADARTLPLDGLPLADDDVVHGSPVARLRALDELGGVEVGVWEITPGTVRDTEVDEVFVVLSGAGTVAFEDGEVLALAPGTAVRLRAGERTTWTVTSPLRKIWVA